MGALCTYTRLVPASAVSDVTRESLSQQVESRPKVQVLVWIEGMYVRTCYLCDILYSSIEECHSSTSAVELCSIHDLLVFALIPHHSSFTTPFLVSLPSLMTSLYSSFTREYLSFHHSSSIPFFNLLFYQLSLSI